MTNQMPWARIAKYLAGEDSPEDRREFERWVAASPDRARLVDSMRPYMAARTPEDGPKVDVEAAWRRLESRMRDEPFSIVTTGAPPARFTRTAVARSGAIAATAVIAASVGWLFSRYGAPPVETRTVAAASGEKRTLTLGDGSQVVLAPGGRVTVTVSDRDRDVELSGDAVFSVTHDRTRPFRVRAGAFVIEDIGTVFEVRAGAERLVVSVSEGEVALRRLAGAPTAATSLVAGQMAVAERDGLRVSRAESRAADWTRGELSFQDEALTDVATELTRWYGTPVRVDADVAARRVSVTLAGESTAEAARAIARALGISVAVERDGIAFSK